MLIERIPKFIKITLPIIVVIILLVLFFIYPGYLLDSYGMKALENQRFTLWDNKNLAEQLTREANIIETAFRNNFLKKFEIKEKLTEFEGIISSIELKDKKNISINDKFTLKNQLLWGEYLMLSGQEKEFQNWLEMLESFYLFQDSWALVLNKKTEVLEKTENTWQYDLQYAEILLHSYNQKPSQKIFRKIQEIMERTWFYFDNENLAPNCDTNIERIIYPETSSDSVPVENEELFDPYRRGEFIRLSDVNLYVLESFALIDEKWQEPYEKWSRLIVESIDKESIFYPVGVWPDQEHYLSTINQAFSTLSIDNIKIIHNLSSEQENSNSVGFFYRKLLQSNNLAKAYHIASEQSISDQSDLQAMALFSQHLLKEDPDSINLENKEVIEAIQSGLMVHQYRNEFNDLNNLFYQENDEKSYIFSAVDQLAILNSRLLK